MATRTLRILLSGMMAGQPHQGGATWAVLQYLRGFERLGHEVTFVEPVPSAAWLPAHSALHTTVNAGYFNDIVREFALHRSALLHTGTRQTVGLSYDALENAASQADVLFNISGMLNDEQLIRRVPVRVYLDLDPAFNQLWDAVQGIDMNFASHTHHVTVGQALGEPGCAVPLCGREWIKIFPPVVLHDWPAQGTERIQHHCLTTIGNWRAYGSIEHQDVFFGQKAHSLRRFMDLPRRTEEKFLLALAIHPDEKQDLASLKQNGWNVFDANEASATPDRYRRFIQGSKAEFGIAKSGYVVSRCGWFSDRSACYLASARPVIAQDTGFASFLPTGQGLFSFSTADDACAALECLHGDYCRHAKAARALAEDYFDSDKVLSRLLRQVGL